MEVQSTPAQSSVKVVGLLQRELVLVLWQDGKMIGSVKTTHEELAVPGSNEETTKAEIISSLRGFCFEKWDSGDQCTKGLLLNIPPPPPFSSVIVKTLTGKSLKITYGWGDPIELIKVRIQDKEGIPPDQQRLIYDGKELRDNNTLACYGVENYGPIHLVLKLRGGGSDFFKLPVDLSKPQVHNGNGVDGGERWECYSKGFNLLGHCANPKCVSKGQQVCIQLKFGNHILTDSTKEIRHCPACWKASITVRTFLISAARAKIRFRKSFSNSTETLIFEAPSHDYGQYAELLANKEDDDKVAYDFIEITTVHYGMSFNRCQGCNNRIPVSEEKVASCGRAFHQHCFGNANDGCSICHLPEFTLTELPRIVACNQDKRVRLDVPNHVFGRCSSGQSGDRLEAKPIEEFLKELTLAEFETSSTSQISITELQQNFVAINLPYLIRNTLVTPRVLEKLRELEAISASEETELDSIRNKIDKVKELYKIVPTRGSGITALMTALGETGQHRAVLNLSMFDTMLTTYSKDGLLGKAT